MVRSFQAMLLLCIAAGGLYLLSSRLTAQLCQLKGEHRLLAGNFSEAAQLFSKAAKKLPHNGDILRQWGDACFKQAAACRIDPEHRSDPMPMLIQARDAYLAAGRENPLDAESFFGAAESEALLSQAYRTRHPYTPSIPYDPLPWFEKAAALRPNGISYHYAMARYLASTAEADRLLPVVRRLASIYPPVYARLKKEVFWSDAVASACLEGIKEAIDNDTMPREAHMAASSLAAAKELWPDAVSHYALAMAIKPFQNVPANDYHLGFLYLKNNDGTAARKTFLKGLKESRDRDRDVGRIFGYYRREKDDAGFMEFYRTAASRMSFSAETELLFVQSLLSLNRFAAARAALETLIRQTPMPRAYYWLAKTGELQQDWDTMELAAQKATIMEEDNSDYHTLFARVLYRLKKYDRAEQAASLAIRYARNPSPWLYHQRASIRHQQKDDEGALADWREALSLKPNYEPFQRRIAEMEKRDPGPRAEGPGTRNKE